jgi:hypothetical protein
MYPARWHTVRLGHSRELTNLLPTELNTSKSGTYLQNPQRQESLQYARFISPDENIRNQVAQIIEKKRFHLFMMDANLIIV